MLALHCRICFPPSSECVRLGLRCAVGVWRSLKPSPQSAMPGWEDHLFIVLARSASDATDFFQIPTGHVVEVSTQVAV
jgi:K+ transporter